MISSAERQRLRQLAEKQLEVFHSEKNQRRVQEWMLHNACKGQRPMIHVETDTFESETITPLLQCQDPVAVGWKPTCSAASTTSPNLTTTG